jgi:RHS repeat-associated protein
MLDLLLVGRLRRTRDAATKLGDFHDGTNGGTDDYSYDGNGNLTLDNNKAISSITYNYLNLPNVITVTAKGTITYTYDAGGNKLKKTTVEGSNTTTTLYINNFVYQNDTLQFIGTEEGRVRWAFHKLLNGSTYYGFEYDYFLKDHLGNTRMVLTQQKDTAQYMATMEAAYRNTENQLFYNIPASNYSRVAVSGYPTDNTTNPNDSLMKLNGSGQKIGAAIVLKVMSGDVLDIAVKSFYKSGGTANSPNPSLTDVLNSFANGIVTTAAGTKGNMTDLNNQTTSPLFSAINSFNSQYITTPSGKPKAYLNWILLDDQLQYVSTYPQSGAVQAGSADVLNTLGYTGIPITKNGYLYIYVTNETPGWDAFFDNLSVQHRPGPILEETHYYPFGLTMAGISSKALNFGDPGNHKKFNGIEETRDLDLNQYDALFRNLDPQIGRWWQIDPKPDYMWSPYSAMNNNPIRYTDPLGDTLRVTGDRAAQKQFIKISNKALGGYYKTKIEKDGTVGFASTGKKGEMSARQTGFHNQVSDVLNEKKVINVGLVQKAHNVIGGSYDLSQIDVSDIAKFGKKEAMSAGSALAHEIIEQNYKQRDGLKLMDAHNKAITAEMNVTGYLRDESNQVDNLTRGPGGNSGTIQIPYTKDGKTVIVTVYLTDNNITKVKEK